MSFLERWMLGTLPFGDGLASRLRALKGARRWPVIVQVLAVGLLGTVTVLAAAGSNVPAPSARVPPLVELHLHVLRDLPAIPKGRFEVHVTDRLLGPTHVGRVNAEALRLPSPDAVKHAWLGATANLELPVGMDPRSVTARAEVRDGHLELQVGWASDGQELAVPLLISPGEVLVMAMPGDTTTTAIVIRAANVTWPRGAPVVASKLVSVSLDDAPVRDLGSAWHADFQTDGELLIDASATDAPLDEVLGTIARRHGLTATLEGSTLVLRDRVTEEGRRAVEHAIHLASSKLRRIVTDGNHWRVEADIEGPEHLRRLLDRLGADGLALGEVNVVPAGGSMRALIEVERRATARHRELRVATIVLSRDEAAAWDDEPGSHGIVLLDARAPDVRRLLQNPRADHYVMMASEIPISFPVDEVPEALALDLRIGSSGTACRVEADWSTGTSASGDSEIPGAFLLTLDADHALLVRVE